MAMILGKELFNSHDVGEAAACLKELGDAFDQEIVFAKLVQCALEALNVDLLAALLVAARNSFNVESGLKGVMEKLAELSIDVPAAPRLLGRLLALCTSADLVRKDFGAGLPLFADASKKKLAAQVREGMKL